MLYILVMEEIMLLIGCFLFVFIIVKVLLKL